MSLQRLIRLARKTGDRLIVHNELEDTDVVIMDIDEYEGLIDMASHGHFRTHMQDDDVYSHAAAHALEADDAEDDEDWTNAADLMAERYPNVAQSMPQEPPQMPVDEDLEEDRQLFEQAKQKIAETLENVPTQHFEDGVESEIDPKSEATPSYIPFQTPEGIGEVEGKPLDEDEPVFLEEPV